MTIFMRTSYLFRPDKTGICRVFNIYFIYYVLKKSLDYSVIWGNLVRSEALFLFPKYIILQYIFFQSFICTGKDIPPRSFFHVNQLHE